MTDLRTPLPLIVRRPQVWRLVAVLVMVATGAGIALSWPVRSGASFQSLTSPPGTVLTVAGIHGQDNDDDDCASGSAVKSELYLPVAVAVYGQNIYVADEGDSCVYMISQSGAITAIAGTGTSGYNGDNQLATDAELNDPQGLAFDAQGDLFIADSQNERIREVTPNGMITTVAGNGIAGYAGDGGPATVAELNLPLGVAVDSSGDLYITDAQNDRVREVSSTGVISTIAGTGQLGYNGDDQPAVDAELEAPGPIVIGPDGGIYFGDVGNNRVREILNGTITTVAGNSGFEPTQTTALGTSLNNPFGLAFDAAGDLYISDSTSCVIREVTANGDISTVVGIQPTVSGQTCGWGGGDGRSGPQTELNRPYGIAFDSAGDLFICDTFNEVVRVMSPSAQGPALSTTTSSHPSTTTTTSTTTSTTTTSPPSGTLPPRG